MAAALTGKHDLGIHTEMLGNAMINLIRSGAVTNRQKTLHPGKTVCAFFLGDEDAVDFLENTPDVMFRPAAYTNHPATIARNENMVSVNTALQVDLLGQVCSESIGSRQYSGTGGAHGLLPTVPTTPPTAAPSSPSTPPPRAAACPASARPCPSAAPCPFPGTSWTMW